MNLIQSIVRSALAAATTATLCAFVSVSPASAQIIVPAAPTNGGEAPKIERKIDAKAKEIYDRAQAATRKLSSIEFEGKMKFADGPGAGGGMPAELKAKSRFQIRFNWPAVYAGKDGGKDGGKEAPRHVVRAQYLDGELEGIVTMLNGGKLMQIDATKKTYTDALDIGGSMLGIAFAACPDWYRDDFGPARMGAPLQLELAGTANIDGLECDLVKVVREIEIGLMDPGQEQPEMQKIPLSELVAFARVDGLPRRVTMGAPMLGGMEEEGNPSGPEVTISAVKLNPKLDDAQFALTAPEGYAKVEPKMPEFAQPAMEGGPAEQLKVKAGDAAPDFKLKDLAGSEVSLASLKGKVVLLDFWATWCGPCKAAMPTMQKLHDEYGSKGVVILGVNTWEQKADAAKDYMASKKFTYGCLLRGDDLAAAYGIKGIPTLVVIGKDGKIAEIEVGLSDPSGGALRKALDALLGK